MSKFIEYLTSSYKQESEFHYRKARHAVAFILFLVASVALIVLLEWLSGTYHSSMIIFDATAILIFSTLLFIIKRGSLMLTVNLMLFAGLMKLLQYMTFETTLLFFLQCSLVLIVTAAVHLNKIQLISAYIFVGCVNFLRLIMLRSAISTNPDIGKYEVYEMYQSVLSFVAFAIIVYFYSKSIDNEITMATQLNELSQTDQLTKLHNRKAFNKTIDKLIEDNTPFVLALIDIDHFKNVNDTFGHAVGDKILVSFSDILQGYACSDTTVYRWGGEEFAVILNGFRLEEAVECVESLRRSVNEYKFEHDTPVTFSAGIAESLMHMNSDELLKSADNALYTAKDNGRNQSCHNII